MSDYGTARREFWERCFLTVWQSVQQDESSDVALEDSEMRADEMLEVWENRWVIKETDAS